MHISYYISNLCNIMYYYIVTYYISYFYAFKNYLSLAVLSLHCCKSSSLVEESRGYSLVVHEFLTRAASLVAECGL